MCWNNRPLLKQSTPLLKQSTPLLKQSAGMKIPSLPVICDSGRVFLEQWKQHEDEQGSGYTDYSEDSTLFVFVVTISFHGRIEGLCFKKEEQIWINIDLL